eukprot:4364480-Amphidinium_carterae.1
MEHDPIFWPDSKQQSAILLRSHVRMMQANMPQQYLDEFAQWTSSDCALLLSKISPMGRTDTSKCNEGSDLLNLRV